MKFKIKQEPMDDAILADVKEAPQKRKRLVRRLVDKRREVNIRANYCRNLERQNKRRSKSPNNRNLIFSIIAFLIFIFIGNYFMNHNVSDLASSYWRNYNQIVHGINYCDENLDADELIKLIRNEQTILHQNEALLEVQSALKFDRQLKSVALVGPVGVGKTLFINALQKHFPWPQNIQSYNWNIYVRHETEKYRSLYMLLEKFSNCGVNLLIVKNLTPAEKELVQKIIENLKHNHNLRKKRIILVFVFNLNTMLSDAEYSAQKQSLQNLKYTISINFKSFGKEELKDCIERELKLENMTVSHGDYEELLNSIDVKRSGCKNVNSKVLAFAYRTKLSKSLEN